jgi:ATPase subunit of ABC transporter with duplicated ATPase domains
MQTHSDTGMSGTGTNLAEVLACLTCWCVSGVDIRPITETEIRLHLESYGIMDDLATSKLKGFSGGQKSRVVIAAAMWTKPHLICLGASANPRQLAAPRMLKIQRAK